MACPHAISVSGRAAPTAAVDALDRLLLRQLRLGHAADARAAEVCLFGLDAAEAAELVGWELVGVVFSGVSLEGWRRGGVGRCGKAKAKAKAKGKGEGKC